ncbi:type II secretion system protein [Candidatus Sumerlaeota bacterium]|nr:type II secretion system protein [Candidatus Sumerlaeota bacterium]
MQCDKRRRAFTLIEILAVMVFMAIVIPAAVQGVRIAGQSGKLANQKRIAAELAENQLVQTVVTEEWINGEREGDFGEDWPGFRWELEVNDWESDSAMQELTISVFYTSQNKEHSVQLTTLAQEEDEESDSE